MEKEIKVLGAKTTEEVVAELKKEGITAKVDKKQPKKLLDKKAKKEIAKKKENKTSTKATGIITVKDLEQEFGLKAKVIRRYLRKMEESSKPRGPEKYQWDSKSKELKIIRKNLEAVVNKKVAAVR